MINQPYVNQKGFIIPVVVVVVIAAAIAIGGYFYLVNKTGNSNPLEAIKDAASGVSLNSNCIYNDPDLCKFVNNWPNIKSYATTSNYSVEGSSYSTTLTVDNGNTHTVSTIAGTTRESIEIGDTTYTKDPSDGKWWKEVHTPSATPTPTEDEDTTGQFELPKEENNQNPFTKAGKEACGKLTCFKYTMAGDDNNATTIWFDDTQYKIRKMTVGNIVTTQYSYDNTAVKAPGDTKDLPDNYILLPDGTATQGSSGMSPEQLQQLLEQYQAQ